MRHEIRHSAGHQCDTCGSFDLIYVAPDHRALARELGIHLDAPWWRPLKRRWCRNTVQRLNGEMDEFVTRTRFPIVDTPTSSVSGAALGT